MQLDPVETVIVFHPDGRSPMVVNADQLIPGAYRLWEEKPTEEKKKGKKPKDVPPPAGETEEPTMEEPGETGEAGTEEAGE